MKTYEEVIVSQVVAKLDGIVVLSDTCPGGYLGGVPDLFDCTSLDATNLMSKRGKRTPKQKEDDDESPEEFEFRILYTYGLSDDSRNRGHWFSIKRKVKESEEKFNYYLRKYRYAENDFERFCVISLIVNDIEDCLRRGTASPADFFFLRRFGVYV